MRVETARLSHGDTKTSIEGQVLLISQRLLQYKRGGMETTSGVDDSLLVVSQARMRW